MIEGTPLLATLDGTGTIRTMELNSNGVFQQIAAQGGFTTTVHGPEYALVDWAVNNVIVARGSGTSRFISLHNVLMEQLKVVNQGVNGSTQQWRVGYNKISPLLMILDRTAASVSNKKVSVLLEDLIVESHAAPSIIPTLQDVAISPDNVKISGLADTLVANVLNPNGFNGNLTWPNSLTVASSVGKWDRTSRFLVTGKKGTETVSVLKFASNTFSKTFDIIEVGKTLHAIAMSPHANMMAISWVEGGVYITKIYRRLGSFYQEVQSVNSFGQLLDFSADGTLIIDCLGKKALKRNALTGSFEENNAAMVNVASGIVGQAMSDHVPVLFPIADFYQTALDLTVGGALDLSKFKITLAKADAPGYDPEASTLADVLGDSEVTAGYWPAGGMPLVNPAIVSENLSADIVSDAIERIIIETGIEFRYAILHHDGTPILRHDYQQTVAVARDDKLVIEVPLSGVLSYVA